MKRFLRPGRLIPALTVLTGLLGAAAPAYAQATITIINEPGAANEGNTVGNENSRSFVVRASVPAMGTAATGVTVAVTRGGEALTAGSLASGGSDIDSVVTSLDFGNIAAGAQVDREVVITVNEDTTFEDDETVTITLSSPAGGGGGAVLGGDTEGITTILNDDAVPVVSIANAANTTEGNVVSFPVTLSNPSENTVTVDYDTFDGAGLNGASSGGVAPDYVGESGVVTFVAGDTAETITVDTVNDATDENNETFSVLLTDPTNATIGNSVGQAVIVDNDAGPTVSINNVTVCEDDGTATFTITLSSPSALPTSLTVDTASGPATGFPGAAAVEGADFTDLGATVVNFTPGDTTRTVTVNITDETALEATETFRVLLSGLTGITEANSDLEGAGTILDDDNVATIELDNVTTQGTVLGFGGPQQCFLATARNACGDVVPNFNLFFDVDSNTGDAQNATVTTNALGQALFCFTPRFPGTYEVTVEGGLAEVDSPDIEIDLPFNTANSDGEGSGVIDGFGNFSSLIFPQGGTGLPGGTTPGNPAFFTFNAAVKRNGRIAGVVNYVEPGSVIRFGSIDISAGPRPQGGGFPITFTRQASPINFRSSRISALQVTELLNGGQAITLFGVGKFNKIPGTYQFRVDAVDINTPGVPGDRFVLDILTPFTTILNLTPEFGTDNIARAGGPLRFTRIRGYKANNDVKVRSTNPVVELPIIELGAKY